MPGAAFLPCVSRIDLLIFIIWYYDTLSTAPLMVGRSHMRKNEDRKRAEKEFLGDRGRITNKELAKSLGVHPATVARWRKLDEWDVKLVQSITDQEEPDSTNGELYEADLRHLAQLNDRIEAYLQKKELLPSEILELAQAKFHIMTCMEIVYDNMRYPLADGTDEDDDF